MLLCDLTFSTPEENLACDEVLLEQCESTGRELLRFWEPSTYFVVVGYANRVEIEASLSYCREKRIPVLRRCTGGGTVLQGPGCLNYSLILHFDNTGPLNSIEGTNAYILERHRQALAELVQKAVKREGQTDLAIGGLKFSGNAQRRRKDFLLFHGTFLLNFELSRITEALPLPSRQPEYRRNRSHAEFLVNLQISSEGVKKALAQSWAANEPQDSVPRQRVAELVREKYGTAEWTYKF